MKIEEPIYLKVDSRNRISLTKISKQLSNIYRAYIKDNRIILEPIKDVKKEVEWIFKPENKEFLESILRGLKQEPKHDFNALKKELKD